MDPIILENKSGSGSKLQATFLPDRGMNMISYKKDDTEIIDQSTRPQFEERCAGLGALTGPHFYKRLPETIPPIKDENLFPYIDRTGSQGSRDPFSHGIARYAPWKAEATKTKVSAVISGKDEWNGVSLASLEGQNFKMTYDAELTPEGLQIAMTVVSDSDSVVGLHYYYALPNGGGKVISDVKSSYYDGIELKNIPSEWNYNSQHILTYDLSQSADFAFHPFFNPLKGKILLDAGNYRLETHYWSSCEENSWQLYYPQGASFVAIEPVSSQNPRRPNLTASSINILLKILDI